MPAKLKKKHSKSFIRARNLRYQHKRRRFLKRQKKLMQKNELPPPVTCTKKEFAQLQDQWYNKLERSGFKDIESRGPDPVLKSPSSRARPWTGAQKQLYYYLAQQYATHNTNWSPQYMRTAWTMHAAGRSFREILQRLSQWNYGKSIYTLFYELEEEAKKCVEWNRVHPEGGLYEANYDTLLDAPDDNATWGFRLAEGFWEEVGEKHWSPHKRGK